MSQFHQDVDPQSLDDISRAGLLGWLAHLDRIDNPRAIVSEAQYQVAHKVKRMLAALYCLTFNDSHEAFERVSAMEGKYGEVMHSYNKSLLLKDRRAILVARYMLWNYRLTDCPRTPFLVARAYGLLRKVSHVDGRMPTLVVIGLERKVGDNLFTTGANGRNYRTYNRTIGRQAFEICLESPFTGEEQAAFDASIPELDQTYHVTSIGDGKFCAKPSAFSRRALADLAAILNGQWTRTLRVATLPALDETINEDLPVLPKLEFDYIPEASGAPTT